MAKCGICGEEHPRELLFRHQWDDHPEEMRARSGRASGRGKKQTQQHPTPPGGGKRAPAHELSPVHAALVEFASKTLVVPNIPALIYGFMCARKFGFKGDIALFLQEVIDDFYASRECNYYQEVLEWTEIGKEMLEPAASPSGDGVEAVPPSGTGDR